MNPNKVEWDGWIPEKAWMNELASYLQDTVAVRKLYESLPAEDKRRRCQH